MDDRTLKEKLAAIRRRDCARSTGDYNVTRDWAKAISTVELAKELAESERDAKPVPIACSGGRVVRFQPVPPYKLTWVRALRDELATRSDQSSRNP